MTVDAHDVTGTEPDEQCEHQGRRRAGRSVDRHGVERPESSRPSFVEHATGSSRRSPSSASCRTVRLASSRPVAARSSPTSRWMPAIRSSPMSPAGVEETIRGTGCRCSCATAIRIPTARTSTYATSPSSASAGVLITAVEHGEPADRPSARRKGIPWSFCRSSCSTRIRPEWCAVGVDDVEGGDLAVEHLVERGHRRIAFIGGPHSIPQVADRTRAVPRERSSAPGSPPMRSRDPHQRASASPTDGRRARSCSGIPARRRPTAAFCANDLVAVGLLQHLTQQGVGVPDDIAIVGYDDIEYAVGGGGSLELGRPTPARTRTGSRRAAARRSRARCRARARAGRVFARARCPSLDQVLTASRRVLDEPLREAYSRPNIKRFISKHP